MLVRAGHRRGVGAVVTRRRPGLGHHLRRGNDPACRCDGRPDQHLVAALGSLPHRLVHVDEAVIPANDARDHGEAFKGPDAAAITDRTARDGDAPFAVSQDRDQPAALRHGDAAQVEQGQGAPVVQFDPRIQIPGPADMGRDMRPRHRQPRGIAELDHLLGEAEQGIHRGSFGLPGLVAWPRPTRSSTGDAAATCLRSPARIPITSPNAEKRA